MFEGLWSDQRKSRTRYYFLRTESRFPVSQLVNQILHDRLPLDVQLSSLEELKNPLTCPQGFCLVDSASLNKTLLNTLLELRRLEIQFILWNDKTLSNEVLEYYNSGLFCGIASVPNDLFEIAQRLEQRLSRDYVTQQTLLKQNRNLESENVELLQLRKQGSVRAAESQAQVREKLKKQRSLLGFIKSASDVFTIEDLYTLLRANFRQFHDLKRIYLLTYESGSTQRLLFQNGNQLQSRKVHWAGADNFKLDFSSDSMQKNLVKVLAIPVGRLAAVPLLSQGGGAGSLRWIGTVLFEHNLLPQEFEKLLQPLNQYLHAFSLALDRLILEVQLKTTAYLWERTFDTLGDPLAILSRDHRLIRANKSFLGGRHGELCFNVLGNESGPCTGCPLMNYQEGAGSIRGSIHVEHKSYAVNSFPIPLDLSGESVFVHHYVDVSRAKELRSRMLQNEKMIAIGHLAGHIAHELNNPLTGIRSLAQVLLTETKINSRTHDDLIEVEKACERCQTIINNLLGYGEADGQQQQVDLNELISKTLPLLKTVLSVHESHFKLNKDKLTVFVEPNLLQQVIFNITNNACQAMERGEIIFSSGVLPDNYCYFSIQDTGHGIPANIRERIFEPFFTTKPIGQGTGLGLSMCKRIVDKFSGHIEIDSTMGVGTTVTIVLPRVMDENVNH